MCTGLKEADHRPRVVGHRQHGDHPALWLGPQHGRGDATQTAPGRVLADRLQERFRCAEVYVGYQLDTTLINMHDARKAHCSKVTATRMDQGEGHFHAKAITCL